jgi:hypothetical protein
MILFFQIIAVVFALIAALLWYMSTKIATPPSLGVSIIAGDDDTYGDNAVKQWASKVSEKNRCAALATAVSVGAQGLATLVSLLST